MRMTEVEADADVRWLEIVFHEVNQRGGRRDLVLQHFDGDLHAERLSEALQLLYAPPRCGARISAARRLLRPRYAQMRDQRLDRNAARDVERELRFSDGG